MKVLEGLKPAPVWRFFEEISNIPRASYHEKAISDYVCEFAKSRGLTYYQDELYNVVIMKEATPGYEDVEPYIIQGHLDMVCEKEEDCTINFDTDGLQLAVNGDFVYAKGTTLGGDDGIAVAYALALLDAKDIAHPKLEVVLTVSEEVGMDGAAAINLHMLEGHQVLNLDSEEEGIFLTSCAGGCVVAAALPVSREKKDGILYRIFAKGMTGGHSGCEIHRGRANATLVLGRVLYACREFVQLCELQGGLKDNAIPREAQAVVLVEQEKEAKFLESCKKESAAIQREYQTTEPALIFEWKREEAPQTADVLTQEAQMGVLRQLVLSPNGVQSMSADIEGLVETSLNMGVARLEEDKLQLSYSIRSSVQTAREHLAAKVCCLTETLGGKSEVKGNYPGWEYRKNSPLRERMIAVYERMYGKKPLIQAIHAGLECGILAEKIKDMDCVSFGPAIFDIHTVEERMSISSVERTWNYLLALLQEK